MFQVEHDTLRTNGAVRTLYFVIKTLKYSTKSPLHLGRSEAGAGEDGSSFNVHLANLEQFRSNSFSNRILHYLF